MAGYIGSTPVPQATQHRETFTATNGQTSFATVGYTPQFLDVYLNGVKLAPADFTATNGSDIILASGAATNDILEVVAYTPFEVANQTFTGTTTAANLSVTGNASFGDNNKAIFGAELEIYSDATHARIREYGSGQLKIQGDNMQLLTSDGASTYLEGNASTGAVTLYHASNAPRVATTSFGAQVTGSLATDTITNATANTDVTIDTNFDIILDAGGNVGIGNSSPDGNLTVGDTSTSGDISIRIKGDATSRGFLMFGDAGGAQLGDIMYDHSDNHMRFRVNNSERMRITSTGELLVGTTSDTIPAAAAAGQAIMAGTRTFIATESGGDTILGGTTGSNFTAIYQGGTERIRIDSSGRVGIGTTSPNTSYLLDVSGAIPAIFTATSTAASPMYGGVSVKRETNTNGNGTGLGFLLEDAGGANTEYAYIGGIIESNTAGSEDGGMILATTLNNTRTERMRIDSSGGVHVGGTSESETSQVSLNSSGYIKARKNNVTGIFDRITTDGDIVQFRKDGATVGSIGTTSSRLYAGTGDTGLFFNDQLDSIDPWNTSTNAARSAAIDLGDGGRRFKDLYLSGGVDFGGAVNSGGVVSSSNKLDDYEEGTWTPTAANGLSSFGIQSATYTKVGRVVTVMAYLSSMSGQNANSLNIGGLPYAPAANHYSLGSIECSTSGQMGLCRTNSTNTYLTFYKPASNNTRSPLTGNDVGSSHIIFSITYQTS